jgi:hypothetical protein
MNDNNSTNPLAGKPVRKALRESVEDVYYNLGGEAGLQDWVEQSTVNRRIFYKDILPRLIPREMKQTITGSSKEPLRMVITWEDEDPSPPLGAAATGIMNAITADDTD